MNENYNMAYQNIWNVANVILREQAISLQAPPQETRNYQIKKSNITL